MQLEMTTISSSLLPWTQALYPLRHRSQPERVLPKTKAGTRKKRTISASQEKAKSRKGKENLKRQPRTSLSRRRHDNRPLIMTAHQPRTWAESYRSRPGLIGSRTRLRLMSDLENQRMKNPSRMGSNCRMPRRPRNPMPVPIPNTIRVGGDTAKARTGQRRLLQMRPSCSRRRLTSPPHLVPPMNRVPGMRTMFGRRILPLGHRACLVPLHAKKYPGWAMVCTPMKNELAWTYATNIYQATVTLHPCRDLGGPKSICNLRGLALNRS